MTKLLEEAAADALFTLALSDEVMIVVGRDAGPAAACPNVVGTPGGGARFAVADGIRLAGRRVVIVLDRVVVDLGPVGQGARPTVLLTTSAAHLSAARDAGLTVVQPGWPADVEPLLRAALDAAEPVLVRLHGDPVVGPAPTSRPALDARRVLRRGRAGLLVAAGAGTPLLVRVAAALSERGLDVTAVDLHTIRPVTGVDPARTDRALLTGPVAVEDARQLVPVPIGDGSLGRLADAVEAALRRV